MNHESLEAFHAEALEAAKGQSLQERLLATLTSETLTDVHLVGDDGEIVHASRFLLASCSKVFERMLYGEFSESNAKQVKIPGYNGNVLKGAVGYCYTNKIDTWTDGMVFHQTYPAQVTEDAIQLCHLANTYDMPHLHRIAMDYVSSQMKTYPSMACLVLDKSHDQSLHDSALRLMARSPKSVLVVDEANGGGLACLSPETLSFVWERFHILPGHELFLINVLVQWRDLQSRQEGTSTAEQASNLSKSLATLIDLTVIDPTDICNAVEKSDLYDEQSLLDAYKHQALYAASKEKINFRTSPGEYVVVMGAGDDRVNGVYCKSETRHFAFYKKQSVTHQATTPTVEETPPAEGNHPPKHQQTAGDDVTDVARPDRPPDGRYVFYRSSRDRQWRIALSLTESWLIEDIMTFYSGALSGTTNHPKNTQPNYKDEIDRIEWSVGQDGCDPIPLCAYYRVSE